MSASVGLIAGRQNVSASNSAPKVQKALNSINKVLSRQNSGYYSSARYVQAALTNVSNRFASALAKQQVIMFAESMVAYGIGKITNTGLTC